MELSPMFHNRPAHFIVLSGMLLFAACAPVTSAAQQTGTSDKMPALPSGKQWKLVWSDEFDGNAIDKSKWYTPGDHIARSSGAWSDKALKVGNGVLQFQVIRENGMLVSAGLSTENRFSATYGYWEIRAKLPRTPGYRPAFWLSSKKINDPADLSHPTEIDVLEYPGRGQSVHMNLHWGGYKEFHQTTGSSARVSNPDRFHTYGVWWSSTGYSFYVDGELVWQSTGGGVSTGPEFIRLANEPFPVAPDSLPDHFPVDDNFTLDYVRVFQVE
jgi:beta-glucanase (GH16 family)